MKIVSVEDIDQFKRGRVVGHHECGKRIVTLEGYWISTVKQSIISGANGSKKAIVNVLEGQNKFQRIKGAVKRDVPKSRRSTSEEVAEASG